VRCHGRERAGLLFWERIGICQSKGRHLPVRAGGLSGARSRGREIASSRAILQPLRGGIGTCPGRWRPWSVLLPGWGYASG